MGIGFITGQSFSAVGGDGKRYGSEPGQISTFELFMMGFNPYYSK